MADFDNGMRLLSELRARGVRISIDDFGTGYSSLSYFKQLPLDELKIDASFVRNMVSDEGSRKLVESIIGLAKKFDLSVVAEGVESQLTFDALKSLDCDIAQGFFISEPFEVERVYSWNGVKEIN